VHSSEILADVHKLHQHPAVVPAFIQDTIVTEVTHSL